jgi:hypothetical protein
MSITAAVEALNEERDHGDSKMTCTQSMAEARGRRDGRSSRKRTIVNDDFLLLFLCFTSAMITVITCKYGNVLK